MEKNIQGSRSTDAEDPNQPHESRLSRRQFARYATATGFAAALAGNSSPGRLVQASTADYPYRLKVARECMVTLAICGNLSLREILVQPIWRHIDTYIDNAQRATTEALCEDIQNDCQAVKDILDDLKENMDDDDDLKGYTIASLFREDRLQSDGSTPNWPADIHDRMEELTVYMVLPFYFLPDSWEWQRGGVRSRRRANAIGIIASAGFLGYLGGSSLKTLFTSPHPLTTTPRQHQIERGKKNGILKDIVHVPTRGDFSCGNDLTPTGQVIEGTPLGGDDHCWSISQSKCVSSESDYCEEAATGGPTEMSDTCP